MMLLPTPRRLELPGGSLRWPERVSVAIGGPLFSTLEGPVARFLASAQALTNRPWELTGRSAEAALTLDVAPDLPPSGYRLSIDAAGIALAASHPDGARYGLETLRQVLAQSPEALPHLRIDDEPARGVRGYMLDLSRDKVPTMETLCRLVDDLAALKFNQLQLYTEHTFAYPGHERVWGLASPLRADEVRALDAHCADRGIELVPCLNTFGHWERWLRHPAYFHLAECPYGWRRPDGYGMPWSSTLAPGPESLALLTELFAAYLPLFRSNKVNIGGDEPWELGMGRTRQRCEAEGRHAVYLDFLRQIIAAAGEHKGEVQFWCDILLEAPDLWTPPPGKTVGLVWGYEAGHPFASQVEALRAQGQELLLCPGTSTWNSLGGRLGNALENIREAAACAEHNDVAGLLLTDWGDHGHHQPAILSQPALHAFAQAAWNPAATPPPIEQTLARFAFDPSLASAGSILLTLGDLYRDFAFRPPNRLPLAQVPLTPKEDLDAVAAEITGEELERARARLAPLRAEADAIEPASPEAALAARELRLVLDLHLHSLERLQVHRGTVPARPNRLAAEMARLIGEFEALWIARHRVGGLHESAGRLRAALTSYPSDPRRRPAWPPNPPPA